jgi:DNA-binding CsgD family transcriptional regulator
MSHRPSAAEAIPATDELLQLVGRVYACALAPAEVTDVLRALNASLGGSLTQLLTLDATTGTVLEIQVSDPAWADASRAYLDRWGKLDPRLHVLSALPDGTAMRCHEHFDDDFVAADEFYQRYLNPKRLRWTLAASFPGIAGTTKVICVMRDAAAARFDERAAAFLGQLVPHFGRAAAIAGRLERQAAAVTSATDILRLLPTPCLFTDNVGRCMEGNDAFSDALSDLSVQLVMGRVRFLDPALQSQWESSLFETHTTALGKTLRLTASTGKAWKIHLIPWHTLGPDAHAADRKLILAVFDDRSAQPKPSPGSMASIARLTRAEVEVLGGLLKGMPAKTIALRRSASVNTVRSQIVSILEKTGYNSQKELMASFGSSALPESVFTSSVFHSEP